MWAPQKGHIDSYECEPRSMWRTMPWNDRRRILSGGRTGQAYCLVCRVHPTKSSAKTTQTALSLALTCCTITCCTESFPQRFRATACGSAHVTSLVQSTWFWLQWLSSNHFFLVAHAGILVRNSRIVRTNLVRGFLANPSIEEKWPSNKGSRVDICAVITISGIAVK
jgi:hypothetical protein